MNSYRLHKPLLLFNVLHFLWVYIYQADIVKENIPVEIARALGMFDFINLHLEMWPPLVSNVALIILFLLVEFKFPLTVCSFLSGSSRAFTEKNINQGRPFHMSQLEC